MSERLDPHDEYEQLDLLDELLDFDTWFSALPLTPESAMNEGRGAAYWARWRRRREQEGWIRA